MDYDINAIMHYYYKMRNPKEKHYVDCVLKARNYDIEGRFFYHVFFTREEAKQRLEQLFVYSKDTMTRIYNDEIVFLNYFMKSNQDFFSFLKRNTSKTVFNTDLHKIDIMLKTHTKDSVVELTAEGYVKSMNLLVRKYASAMRMCIEDKELLQQIDDILNTTNDKQTYISIEKRGGIYGLIKTMKQKDNFLLSNVPWQPVRDKLNEYNRYYTSLMKYNNFVKFIDIPDSDIYKNSIRIWYPYTMYDHIRSGRSDRPTYLISRDYYEYREIWYDFFATRKDVEYTLTLLKRTDIPKDVYTDFEILINEFKKSKYRYFLDFLVSEGKLSNVPRQNFYCNKMRDLLLQFSHNDSEFEISLSLKEKFFYNFFDVLTSYILYIAVNHYYPQNIINRILEARNLARQLLMKGKVDNEIVDKLSVIFKERSNLIYGIYDRFKMVSYKLEPMSWEKQELYDLMTRDRNIIYFFMYTTLYNQMSLITIEESNYIKYMSNRLYDDKIAKMREKYKNDQQKLKENEAKLEIEREKYRKQKQLLAENNKCTNVQDMNLNDIRDTDENIYIVEENGKLYCYSEGDIELLNGITNHKMPYTGIQVSNRMIGDAVKACGKNGRIIDGKIVC